MVDPPSTAPNREFADGGNLPSVDFRGRFERFSQDLEAIMAIHTADHATVNEKLRDYIELGKQITGFENGFVSRIEGQDYFVLESSTVANKLAAGASFALCDTLCMDVVNRRRTVCHARLKKTDLYALPGRAFLDTEAVIGTPFVVNDEVVGTLTFCSTTEQSEDDELAYRVNIVHLIGEQVGKYLETVRTQRELTRMNKLLSQRSQAVEEFTFATTHDLQESPRSILQLSSFIEKRFGEQLPVKARKKLQRIHEVAQRMQQQIAAIHKYAQIGTGAHDQVVNLNKVVRAAQRRIRERIRESAAEIEVAPLPEVHGNARELQMLFENLLDNALHFSKKNEAPRIQIRASTAEPGLHEITFRDEGVGMENSWNDLAFRMFGQLHDARKAPGTGFGLTLCRKIVNVHGGEIWFESAPQQGTTFFFTLQDDHEHPGAPADDPQPD